MAELLKVFPPGYGDQGYITDPLLGLRQLFCNFIVADRSQSSLVSGHSHSLRWILGEYNSTPEIAIDKIKTELTEYISGYFKTVLVSTKYEKDATSSTASYNKYQIDITAVDNGGGYSRLSKTIKVSESGGIEDIEELIASLGNDIK